MTPGALLFMLGSFAFVLGLAGWSFWRILRVQRSRDRAGDSSAQDGVSHGNA